MKARIIQVYGDELEAIEAAQGALGVPWLMGEDGVQGSWWVDADELRAWRLQHTSLGDE
jgi:hypothetical protein